jgi:hypothetical protein
VFTISTIKTKEISMFLAPDRQLVLVVCLLVAPALGISNPVTGIQVGSLPTDCESGNCTAAALAAGALTLGTSTAGTYNFDLTAGDGDIYNVSGTFDNAFPRGTLLGFFPTVTLLSTTAAGADTIKLDMLQDFASGSDSTSWAGAYDEKLPFDLSAAGSSASGQVLYGTNLDPTFLTDGPLGPLFGPGDYDFTVSTTLSPLDGHLLISDFQYTFTFPEGATKGSSISSPVPEPSPTIPVAIGLACLLIFNFCKSPFKRNSH